VGILAQRRGLTPYDYIISTTVPAFTTEASAWYASFMTPVSILVKGFFPSDEDDYDYDYEPTAIEMVTPGSVTSPARPRRRKAKRPKFGKNTHDLNTARGEALFLREITGRGSNVGAGMVRTLPKTKQGLPRARRLA